MQRHRGKQTTYGTLEQEQSQYEIVHGTTLQVLSTRGRTGKRRKRRKVQEVHVFYPDSALGALSRLLLSASPLRGAWEQILDDLAEWGPDLLFTLKNPSSLFLKVS